MSIGDFSGSAAANCSSVVKTSTEPKVSFMVRNGVVLDRVWLLVRRGDALARPAR